jgi:hypothetical protein
MNGSFKFLVSLSGNYFGQFDLVFQEIGHFQVQTKISSSPFKNKTMDKKQTSKL